MNLQGVMELTMACATAGLVIGAVLEGPCGVPHQTPQIVPLRPGRRK